MKAADLVEQLASVLPQVTSLFSSTLTVSSITNIGNLVTVTTSSEHGLATGQAVVVTGTTQQYSIDTLTQIDGIASAATTNDNDLTYGDPASPNVTISGANESDYNGSHVLTAVSNRRNFQFLVDDGADTPATGTIFLEDSFRSIFNGVFIITAASTTTFTYTVAACATPEDDSIGGTAVVRTSVRVSRVVDVERAISSYTQQDANALWAFVVLGDQIISRDRSIRSDGNQTLTKADAVRVREVQPFDVFVIIPTSADLTGGAAKDLAANEVKIALYRALFRFVAPEVLSDPVWCQIAPNSNNTFLYEKAYYVHQFSFERSVDLVVDDGVQVDDDRAFRDLEFSHTNDESVTIWSATVDLDQEAL